jgi:hypothetical protein
MKIKVVQSVPTCVTSCCSMRILHRQVADYDFGILYRPSSHVHCLANLARKKSTNRTAQNRAELKLHLEN